MPAHPEFFDAARASTAWAALAARLAGRPAMRVARFARVDGKRRALYDRGEAPLTAALPHAPSAVLLYDRQDRATARTPVLAFDLDAKQHIDGGPAGRDRAAHDAGVLAAAVEAAGGRCILSAGPTGGHHVWIPLAEPLPLAAAAALGHALRRVCPTLDPAPLGNAATGCLRPPGSPHAAGGFQVLLMPLPAAVAALDAPNGHAVVDALWALVVPTHPDTREAVHVPARAPAPAGARDRRLPLPQRWEVLATRGPAPGEHNGDASLARWHVTLAAVRAGWTADEWVAAIPSWPWLAAQLANPRRLALARGEFSKAAAQWNQGSSVQNPDTSQPHLHGGGPDRTPATTDDEATTLMHRQLRQVRTWLQAAVRSGRLSPATHSVARGVLLFAHAGGSARIQVGVRALAIAAAVSRTTAGAALWELAELGLVRRVGRGIGRGADVWEVDLALGQGLPPARGRIWATRCVFRIIGGHGAAEVYEALAAARGPLSGRALAGALGRSPTTITAHLHELASWGLAAGGGRAGWVLGPSDPDELAIRFGAPQLMAKQVAGFRAERAAWWRWLEARGLERPTKRQPGLGQVALLPGSATQRHSPTARGDRAGPDPHTRAVDLVRAQLGGDLISSTA